MVWLRRAESTFAFRKVVEAGSAREPPLAESRDRLPAWGRTAAIGRILTPYALGDSVGNAEVLEPAHRFIWQVGERVERVGRCAQCADGDAASFERESADPSLPDR